MPVPVVVTLSAREPMVRVVVGEPLLRTVVQEVQIRASVADAVLVDPKVEEAV